MSPKSRQLLADLDRYQHYWGEQADRTTLERYRRFVASTPNCCSRSHLAGHCTGSAFLANPAGDRVLLLFHPKLQRWLQPGGHADGDFDLLRVATREAHEETGLPLEAFEPTELGNSRRTPFDLDIHPIPARPKEPEHFHYDLRFLLRVDPQLELVPETPDLQLRWFALSEVSEVTNEESVLRMVRKMRDLR